MGPCCTWWLLDSSLLFSQLIKYNHPPITLLTNTVVFLLRRGEGPSRLSCTVTKWGGPCASSQYTVMCGIKRRHYRDLWRWPLWWDHVTMALVMRSQKSRPCVRAVVARYLYPRARPWPKNAVHSFAALHRRCGVSKWMKYFSRTSINILSINQNQCFIYQCFPVITFHYTMYPINPSGESFVYSSTLDKLQLKLDIA